MNKKTLFLGIAFLIILIALISILIRRNQTSTDNTSPAQVNLIWWNLFEPEANVKPLIDEYNKTNPNVKIQYVQMGIDDIAGYKTKLIQDLSDQQIISSPDIFPISNNWVGSFEKNIIKAPSSIISSNDLNDFYPIVKSDFYKSGQMAAMPMFIDGLAVIYNKDRLKQAGLIVPNKYWSDFQVEAQKLTIKDKAGNIISPGFSAMLFDNTQFAFDTLNLMFLQSGVQFYDSTGARVKLASQSEADNALKAYNYFVNDTSNATWDEKQPMDIVSFIEGKLAYYIAPSWRIINILNYNKKYNLNLNIGVAPVPQLSGSDEVAWASYWGLTVSKDSQNSNEAWKFFKFLTEANQIKLLNDTIIANGRPIGLIPPRLSMLKDVENDPYLGVYASSLLKARGWNMYDYDDMKLAYKKLLTNEVSTSNIDSAIDSVVSNIVPAK